MFAPLARACLLIVLGVCTSSLGSGQPPEQPKLPTMQPPRPLGSEQPVEQPKGIPPTKWTRPNYTAFPNLKPVPKERVKLPDGEIPLPLKWVPHPIPELGANPTALRRVRFEQLYAGLEYIARIEVKEAIVGGVGPDYSPTRTLYVATLRIGAELEEDLAKRVPWFEARVRVFKEIERNVAQRVEVASEEPQRLSQARFARLEAEAELLELQAEIERAKKK